MSSKGKISINLWSEDSRPRERLLSLGAQALSNAELLAILVHSGSTSQNAVELTQSILNRCGGSLERLGQMSFEELTAFSGIGPAKAVTLMAAFELGRRRMQSENLERLKLDSSKKIFDSVLRSLFWDLPEEQCWALYLNQSLHFLAKECVGKGGITSVSADVRTVLKQALLKGAVAVVLAHNHPSGAVNPSRIDDQTTQSLAEGCRILNLRFLDHIIVYNNAYYSYAEQGRL